jgi:hypothetical protein
MRPGSLNAPLEDVLRAPLLLSPCRKESTSMVDPQRTEQERIRLGDCRNVIELMDEVKTGQLRATLVALQAGNFGGTGMPAQIGFVVMGVAFIAWWAADLVLTQGNVPIEQELFEGGFVLVPVLSASCMARSWYLWQLGRHLSSCGQDGAGGLGGATDSTDKGAELRDAKETDRLNRTAHTTLCVIVYTTSVWCAWFDVHYYVRGGNIDAEPIVPNDPSTAFFVTGTAGVAAAAASFARVAWLFSGGHMKAAQMWFGWAFAAFGAAGVVCATIAENSATKVVAGAVGGLCLLGFASVTAYLRFRQDAAMTPELKEDIAQYNAAWGAIINNPVQAGYVNSIETKLEQAQVDAEAKSVARPTFELEQRSTAEQLVIMLAQAWGLNDTFQSLVDAWKDKLLDEGHLPQPGAAGEREKGLLPKRRKRAIEKVWRGYAGDATRLRDLVRCSLVFETAEHVEAALDLILVDPAVRILRVKNRFASTYDAKESCGYRDIQLNAVVTEQNFEEEGLALGLHEHVCEIQLHLAPIYEKKNDEGHKRYVKYRNERAE